MKLGVIYHMPFWKAPDGALFEIEGSFARYVDSLSPYFEEISVCAPSMMPPASGGTRVRSTNVTLAPLQPFEGPKQFYPNAFAHARAIADWVATIDLLHCRVPTPGAFFAVRAARRRGIPTFLLVVGDLKGLLPTLPYRGAKRQVYRVYTALEERALAWMVRRTLTFTNGAALAAKHAAQGGDVVETRTTTIAASDIATRSDTCGTRPVRLLTVSRIDPRKGLGSLPPAVKLLVDAGADVTIDIVGPTVGAPGAAEREAIEREAVRLGVADRIRLLGAVPLERLMPRYRDYDLFVLPTLPGEGIPRVLLESMAAGMPVVSTRVAGIPSLVVHETNGYLVDRSTPEMVSAAVLALLQDPLLRRRIIQGGYQTARAHTLDAQAAAMMDVVASRLGLPVTSRARAS